MAGPWTACLRPMSKSASTRQTLTRRSFLNADHRSRRSSSSFYGYQLRSTGPIDILVKSAMLNILALMKVLQDMAPGGCSRIHKTFRMFQFLLSFAFSSLFVDWQNNSLREQCGEAFRTPVMTLGRNPIAASNVGGGSCSIAIICRHLLNPTMRGSFSKPSLSRSTKRGRRTRSSTANRADPLRY